MAEELNRNRRQVARSFGRDHRFINLNEIVTSQSPSAGALVRTPRRHRQRAGLELRVAIAFERRTHSDWSSTASLSRTAAGRNRLRAAHFIRTHDRPRACEKRLIVAIAFERRTHSDALSDRPPTPINARVAIAFERRTHSDFATVVSLTLWSLRRNHPSSGALIRTDDNAAPQGSAKLRRNRLRAAHSFGPCPF
jgi:hypothetical protein